MLMFSSLGNQKQTTSVYWILGFQHEQSVLFLSLLPNQWSTDKSKTKNNILATYLSTILRGSIWTMIKNFQLHTLVPDVQAAFQDVGEERFIAMQLTTF